MDEKRTTIEDTIRKVLQLFDIYDKRLRLIENLLDKTIKQ